MTLLSYALSPRVTAFSTTRLSPFQFSAEEEAAMGTYASFNVTHYCGDDPKRVQRNREWLAQELGIAVSRIWLPRQTHAAQVRCIDDEFLKLDESEQTSLLDEVDALVTNVPGQCIGVSTADCVPILLYDEEHHAAAAIHAGWRGTVQNIVRNTVCILQERYQTRPENLRAVIGPAISAASYEVGEEVVTQFTEAGFPAAIIQRAGYTKPHLDLWAANVWLLEEAGIPLEHIQVSGVCTFSQSDTFFSARRLGIQSGRIYTALCLKAAEA